MPEPTTYGYARAPSERLVAEGLGLDEQAAAIRAYADDRALPGVRPIPLLVDAADQVGIRLGRRPAGSELIARVKPGDHVVFPRIGIGFHTLIHCTEWFEDWRRREITAHVLDVAGLPLDPRTPTGRLIARTLIAAADVSRENTSDHLRGWLRATQDQGRIPYRHQIVWGFRNVKAKDGVGYVTTPDPRERAIMGQLLDWREGGWSFQQIRDHLNNVLRRPGPRGRATWVHRSVADMIDAERALRQIEQGGTTP